MAKKKASRSGSRSRREAPPTDFETALSEVEQIVMRLESGELGLSDSLQQYEEGIQQLKRCHALLDAAEQRVTQLAGFDAEGNPITEPIEPASVRTGGGRTGSRGPGGGPRPSGRPAGPVDPEAEEDPGLF